MTVRSGLSTATYEERATHALAVMQAAGYEPLEPYQDARAPWPSRHLLCGNVMSPSYNKIQQGRLGCRYCSGQFVEPDAAVKVMQAGGVEPLTPYPGSNVTWRCRCLSCGRVVYPRYVNLARGGLGCKYCTAHATDPKEATAVMRRAGVVPLEPFPGANVPWCSRCKRCRREVRPRYKYVADGGNPCSYCSVRRVDAADAVAFVKGRGLVPLEPFPGVNEPWLCRCQRCRKKVVRTFRNLRKGGPTCPKCEPSNLVRDTSLGGATAAEVMREVGGVEPLTSYPGSKVRWLCRCLTCGREVTPTYGNVRQGHRGCKWCARGRMATT